jgi:hypothetical protein
MTSGVPPYRAGMDDAAGQQWSPSARAAYIQRTEDFLAALRSHTELTVRHQGRQRELEAYFLSQGRLYEAATAFVQSEFDWCGSFPLPLDSEAWDDDDDGSDEAPQGDGSVLTVISRWDYRITDPDALVGAGRQAYLAAWVSDTPDDAEVRVSDPVTAVSEILHLADVGTLDTTAGLKPWRATTQVLAHDGLDDFDTQPFGIATTD